LHELCQKQLITIEEAMKWCSNPADFELKNKGIQMTNESWQEVEQDMAARERARPTDSKRILGQSTVVTR